MSRKRIKATTLLVLAAGLATVYGGTIQIGDFRIGQSTYTADTFFDPGFDEPTRSVPGAPVNIVSRFTGTSQEAGRGDIPDTTTGTDIGLRTWTANTVVLAINRYNCSVDAGSNGVARIGAVQWHIDLSPLEDYLTNNVLMLTELDLELVLGLLGSDNFDAYLSYTDPSAGTTLTSISTSNSTANYYDFWWAANGAAEGDFIGNKFEVIKKSQVISGTISDSLLALYNSGVREFYLSFMTGGYHPITDVTKIEEGAGLFMTTAPDTGPDLGAMYETWIADYDLSGSPDADPYTDYDNDLLSNLEEYAFGGNPTNPADIGHSSSFAIEESGGTNWVVYIYPQNHDAAAAGLDYALELTDNLVVGPWGGTGLEMLGIGLDAYGIGFDAVTNRISTEDNDSLFLKLRVDGL